MSRLEDILKRDDVDADAKGELKDAQESVKDLQAIAQVAASEGGQKLFEMLKEDCRDVLVQMLNTKKVGEVGWEAKIVGLLSDFEAKFTLYNTLKSANQDAEDAEEQLEQRIEEIIEG